MTSGAQNRLQAVSNLRGWERSVRKQFTSTSFRTRRLGARCTSICAAKSKEKSAMDPRGRNAGAFQTELTLTSVRLLLMPAHGLVTGRVIQSSALTQVAP